MGLIGSGGRRRARIRFKDAVSVSDLTFPLPRGFIIAPNETFITDTPSMHLLFNDGTATVKEDLYVIALQQIRTILL